MTPTSARHIEAPPPHGVLETAGVPTFSVLIAAHDSAPVVGDAILSALGQTTPPLEVIVCDDGSSDGLAAALRPFAGQIVVLRQENRGEAAAKNAAAAAAAGDYVAILDADDVYLPERLESLGALAAERPDLDILTTDAYLEVDGRFVRRCYEASWPFEVHDQRGAILERNFVFGLAAVRRLTLLAAGGFDESLRWASDWDCWIRLIHGGARVGLVSQPLARYRLSATSLSARRTALYQGRVAVLEKAMTLNGLSPAERSRLRQAVARERTRVAVSAAHDALRANDPAARRLALASAVAPGVPLPTRLRALAAGAAPRLAGQRLRRASPHGPTIGAAGVVLGDEREATTPTGGGPAPR